MIAAVSLPDPRRRTTLLTYDALLQLSEARLGGLATQVPLGRHSRGPLVCRGYRPGVAATGRREYRLVAAFERRGQAARGARFGARAVLAAAALVLVAVPFGLLLFFVQDRWSPLLQVDVAGRDGLQRNMRRIDRASS
jgi:hypothetical protein